MENLIRILSIGGPTGISYKVGSLYFEPTWIQAVLIVVLIFLLLFTLARVRYLYVHWNLGRSTLAMFFWGFLLALILEGFLVISGRTIFTEILGWRNPPKPIGRALELGRQRLVDVLGVSDEVDSPAASTKPTSVEVMGMFDKLSPKDAVTVSEYICK